MTKQYERSTRIPYTEDNISEFRPENYKIIIMVEGL